MPFIAQKRRDEIGNTGLKACKDVGDLCYVFYYEIMKCWKMSKRWQTADTIKAIIDSPNSFEIEDKLNDATLYGPITITRAKYLAWDVFFHLHVMPYELAKQKENGDI